MVPGVVLIDLILPGRRGTVICRTLRAAPETVGIAVTVLTAPGEETDCVLGLELGADDYVMKPFSVRASAAHPGGLPPDMRFTGMLRGLGAGGHEPPHAVSSQLSAMGPSRYTTPSPPNPGSRFPPARAYPRATRAGTRGPVGRAHSLRREIAIRSGPEAAAARMVVHSVPSRRGRRKETMR